MSFQAKFIRSVSHLEILPPESEIDLSYEMLPSMDRTFHKLVSAKDLVQEDVGDIKSDSESLLTTDKVPANTFASSSFLKWCVTLCIFYCSRVA